MSTISVAHTRIQISLKWNLNTSIPSLACPYANQAILSAFNHVSLLYTYTLYDGGRFRLFSLNYTCTAVPLSALDLIIHLHDIFACCTYDSPSVKHHAGDGVFVSISVVYGPCPEIPYLNVGLSVTSS